jgi:formate dehydrogenase major subunit
VNQLSDWQKDYKTFSEAQIAFTGKKSAKTKQPA